MDFSNPKQTLSSPRSLEACNQLGIAPSELYYYSFQDYIALHPEMMNLDKDIQQYRYDHMEKYRLESINCVKEQRNKIIEEQEKTQRENKSKLSQKENTNPYSMESRMDGIIENERRAIEKIKLRQKNEIQALIETEVRSELIRNKSEMKEKRIKEKEEQLKNELHLKAIKEE